VKVSVALLPVACLASDQRERLGLVRCKHSQHSALHVLPNTKKAANSFKKVKPLRPV